MGTESNWVYISSKQRLIDTSKYRKFGLVENSKKKNSSEDKHTIFCILNDDRPYEEITYYSIQEARTDFKTLVNTLTGAT